MRLLIALTSAVLLGSACAREDAGETEIESRPIASETAAAVEPETTLTTTYVGIDFSLKHPADARVEYDDNRNEVWLLPGDRIIGPRVDPDSKGGAYYVAASRIVTHGRASAAAWVDSVRRALNDHEFDEDSLFFVGPATDTTLNGQAAKVLDPPCGDCWVRHFVFARDSTIVVLTYIANGLESWDRQRAQRVGEGIIGSFEWKAASSTR
ncbi:MAG: hypothetical protein IPJ78_19485 [Gemmatimonadetes bacterium]|nr:hypothetical protein [Gemmatimonadota bacterium]